jgi:hypothetical protein
MTTHPLGLEGSLMTAARYRIVVKGRLSDTLGSAFDGLEVEPGKGRTALTGWFEDQSKLHGTLDRIRDFGIELISVNPLEDGDR